MRAGGPRVVRLDRGGDGRGCGPLTPAADALDGADAVLVADYGRGVAARADGAHRAARACARRRSSGTRTRAARRRSPAPRSSRRTPPRRRSPRTVGDGRRRRPARAELGATLAGGGGVRDTRGARRAARRPATGPPLAVPALPATGGDPCGAGDRFAATAAGRLAAGALPSRRRRAPRWRRRRRSSPRAARPGVGAATSPRAPDDAARARRARARPRRHRRRHRRLLRPAARRPRPRRSSGPRARRLPVVCLNSDASVRRLKGPDRPLVGEHDRAAVLARARLRRRRRRLRRGRPARGARALRPTSGPRAATTPSATCPRRVTSRLGRPGRHRALRRRPLDHPPDRGGRAGCETCQPLNATSAPSSSPAAPPASAPRSSPRWRRAAARRRARPVATGRTASTFRVGRPRRRPRAAEAAVARVAEAHGGLDAVVTAAGTDACGDSYDVDADAWDRVVAVNLLGTAAVVRAALPAPRALEAAASSPSPPRSGCGAARARPPTARPSSASSASRARWRPSSATASASRCWSPAGCRRASSTTGPSSTSPRPTRAQRPGRRRAQRSSSRSASRAGVELRELHGDARHGAVLAVTGCASSCARSGSATCSPRSRRCARCPRLPRARGRARRARPRSRRSSR